MSLTSHLDNPVSPVRQFIHAHFPFTRPLLAQHRALLRQAMTQCPELGSLEHSTYPYWLIGHAIDYRIRYYFGLTPWGELVAASGAHDYAEWLRRHVRRYEEHIANQHDLDDAFGHALHRVLDQYPPVARSLDDEAERLLARYCLAMGLFEAIFRRGIDSLSLDSPLMQRPLPLMPEALLNGIPDAWVHDVAALSQRFYATFHARLAERAILNPTFTGSSDVGGADADLILGRCIIEIKTTIKTAIQRDWLYQLVGYTLLDYDDAYSICSLGIYFARQGLLLSWSLGDVLAATSGGSVGVSDLPTLRNEFKALFKDRPRSGIVWGEDSAASTARPVHRQKKGVEPREVQPIPVPEEQRLLSGPILALCDPRTGEPRYLGQGRTPNEWHTSRLAYVTATLDPQFPTFQTWRDHYILWLRELNALGLTPIVRTLDDAAVSDIIHTKARADAIINGGFVTRLYKDRRFHQPFESDRYLVTGTVPYPAWHEAVGPDYGCCRYYRDGCLYRDDPAVRCLDLAVTELIRQGLLHYREDRTLPHMPLPRNRSCSHLYGKVSRDEAIEIKQLAARLKRTEFMTVGDLIILALQRRGWDGRWPESATERINKQTVR